MVFPRLTIYDKTRTISNNNGFTIMAKTSPFHTKLKSDKPVYHDNNKCTEGNNIERKNKTLGKKGTHCKHCKRIK